MAIVHTYLTCECDVVGVHNNGLPPGYARLAVINMDEGVPVIVTLSPADIMSLLDGFIAIFEDDTGKHLPN